jgi:hypothetical protein
VYLQQAFDLANQDMATDPKNIRTKIDFVVACHRLSRLLKTMQRFDDSAGLYTRADEVTHQLAAIDPGNRRSWYLLGKNQLDLGWLMLTIGRPAPARRALLASNEGFERALTLDPQDSVVLECRAGQFEGLARAELKLRNRMEARRWMSECLRTMRAMVDRSASMKDYIYAYSEKLDLARELALSTEGL